VQYHAHGIGGAVQDDGLAIEEYLSLTMGSIRRGPQQLSASASQQSCNAYNLTRIDSEGHIADRVGGNVLASREVWSPASLGHAPAYFTPWSLVMAATN
jgi:hypothetical protein